MMMRLEVWGFRGSLHSNIKVNKSTVSSLVSRQDALEDRTNPEHDANGHGFGCIRNADLIFKRFLLRNLI